MQPRPLSGGTLLDNILNPTAGPGSVTYYVSRAGVHRSIRPLFVWFPSVSAWGIPVQTQMVVSLTMFGMLMKFGTFHELQGTPPNVALGTPRNIPSDLWSVQYCSALNPASKLWTCLLEPEQRFGFQRVLGVRRLHVISTPFTPGE